MSERYSKIFTLKENLYADNVPVLISAGALTKDNQTGKIYAQLRLQNTDTSFRNLIALKVAFTSYDPAGNILDTAKEYQYLDLNIPRGLEFGGNKAVLMDNPATRSFEVTVLEAVFSEGTPWTGINQEWVSLGKQKTLEETLGKELAEQYRRDTFADAKYELFAGNGVWMCACGTLNAAGDSSCCHCHNNKSVLVKALDHSSLAKHLNDHNAEINRQIQQKETEKKKTIKKIMLIILPFIMIGLFLGIKSYVAHQQEEALRLEQERIEAALEAEKRALETLLCSDAWVKMKGGTAQIRIDFYEGGSAYFANQMDQGEGYWKAIDGDTFEFHSSAWGGSKPGNTYDIVYDNGVPTFDAANGVHVFYRISDLK